MKNNLRDIDDTYYINLFCFVVIIILITVVMIDE